MKKVYLFAYLFGAFSLFQSLTAQVLNHPGASGTTVTTSQCGGNYYDPGGAATNYGNNRNSIQVICPSTPGQYVRVQFTSFNTENGWDYLMIFNGNGPDAALIGIYTGGGSPGTITSSDPSGCLSFRFVSDGSGQASGWASNVTCQASPGPVVAASPQDCGGGQGITICSNSSFAGNSAGQGAIEELYPTNLNADPSYTGCLNNGESQSSWYYFSPSAGGTIGFVISPVNGTDDYDFALWGPAAAGTTVPCPAYTGNAPLRCSYSATGGNTGLQAPAVDFSEGVGGDKFVAPISVNAGEIYVLCIDNYSGSSQPFNLNWTFGGGASLDCTPLPIVLEKFDGKPLEQNNLLYWSTASEQNNDYFIIEKSEDGIVWTELGRKQGAGNSNELKTYSMYDPVPYKTTYYRLSQTDFNGVRITFKTIVLERNDNGSANGDVFGFYPNPASDIINVQTYGEGENKVTITDQTGKQLFNTIINGRTIQTITFDNSMNNGLYFITIENQGKMQSGKIIITGR